MTRAWRLSVEHASSRIEIWTTRPTSRASRPWSAIRRAPDAQRPDGRPRAHRDRACARGLRRAVDGEQPSRPPPRGRAGRDRAPGAPPLLPALQSATSRRSRGADGAGGAPGREAVRVGPRIALRSARVCYDHLAGERGVHLFESSADEEPGEHGGDGVAHRRGARVLARFGIDFATLGATRRPPAGRARLERPPPASRRRAGRGVAARSLRPWLGRASAGIARVRVLGPRRGVVRARVSARTRATN